MESARGAKCVSNVRQMALGVTLYVSDHDRYPPARYAANPAYELRIAWYEALIPYLGKWTNGTTVMKCPSYKLKWADFPRTDLPSEVGGGSYGYNGDGRHGLGMASAPDSAANSGVKDSTVRVPARMIALGDSQIIDFSAQGRHLVGMTQLQYQPEAVRKKNMGRIRQRNEGRPRAAWRPLQYWLLRWARGVDQAFDPFCLGQGIAPDLESGS